MSHDQCQSGGGGKTSSHVSTASPPHASVSARSPPVIGAEAERKRVFHLENCRSSVLPIYTHIWEFEEFVQWCVVPSQCQEEDRPNTTRAEAAGVDGRECIFPPAVS